MKQIKEDKKIIECKSMGSETETTDIERGERES